MAPRISLVVSIIDHPHLAERPELVKSALAVFFGQERAEAHFRCPGPRRTGARGVR